MTEEAQGLTLRGTRVTTDVEGNVCLNDLWRLAGEPPSQRPADWHRSKRAIALETALNARMVEILHHSTDDPPKTYATVGRWSPITRPAARRSSSGVAVVEVSLQGSVKVDTPRFRAADVASLGGASGHSRGL